MGSISNSVVALATGAASIEALNSVATLAKNTVAAARDATAKAQKDVDDSSKAADAAQEKLVKAQQTINNAAAAQRNAKTDDEKKKADADMDKAQASLSPAQANYVQSRAQLKNAIQTLKNAQAQLALSSFIHALYEAECYAIARLVVKQDKAPALIVMVPHITPTYEALVEAELPFEEDMRRYKFPPLDKKLTVSGKTITEHKDLPNADLTQAMSDYVDALDLSEYDKD